MPAHLFAGRLGNPCRRASPAGANFVSLSSIGVLAIGVFVFAFSFLLWTALNKIMGARVSPSVEELGQDAAELGIEAYPEFVLMPDQEGLEDTQ